MGIRIVRSTNTDGETGWGVLSPDGRHVHAVPGDYATTAEFITDGRAGAHKVADAVAAGELTDADATAVSELRIESPVTHPCRIVAQGANYRSHLAEVGLDPNRRRFNMLFRKSSTAICGPTDDIVRPPHVRLLDYEVELGLVLGRALTGPTTVEACDLADVVAGFVIANDVSARDIQLPETQFYKAKSYRSFCPTGPVLFLADADDWQRFDDLRLTLHVDNEVRQDAATTDMVFRPAESLSEISAVEDLDPGDVVLTGTPGGVALQPPPAVVQRLTAFVLPETLRWNAFIRMQERNGRYLRTGQRVRATIRTPDGTIDLGVQENLVR